MTERCVIIGAGQAGAQAAMSLRQAKFDGEIVMFGDEPYPPYQRPPLSKAFLKGELEEERLYLRPAAFYEKQNIELRLGEAVRVIDRGGQTVITDKDETVSYDKLLLATGAPPRRLGAPGADLENIHYLRSLNDSEALRSILSCDGRVVIVGAGYIGLEVAAVARAAGRDVTVLEMADRVLARVACEPVSEFFARLHAGAGVDIQLGAALKEFTGEGGAVTGAVLANGDVIECGAALIGIGAAPEISLAEAAKLEIGDGVMVDDHARTSDDHIWAAGDCTNFPSPRYGRRMRLESVPNAIEQAKVAGANMAGGDVVYDALPWFWSDQYDVKLQTVGIGADYDELVTRGDPGEKKFSVWYLKSGAAIAVDAINDPAAFAVGKKLINDRIPVDPERLGDARVDLRELAR